MKKRMFLMYGLVGGLVFGCLPQITNATAIQSGSVTSPSSDTVDTDNSESGFDVYLIDKDGNNVLVEESGSSTSPSSGTVDTDNSNSGFDVYLTDKDGNSVLVEESDLATTSSNTGAVTTETNSGNWFTQFFSSVFAWLLRK